MQQGQRPGRVAYREAGTTAGGHPQAVSPRTNSLRSMVLTLLPFVVLLAVAAAATVTAGGSGPSVVPLPQCREARAGSVSLDAASTTIASDDAFATCG